MEGTVPVFESKIAANARVHARTHATPYRIPSIFLWLPDRTEDRSGLVGKIITFWQRIGSRVFERGGNDGFGGFLRLNSILEKNSKTSFRDRWDRSLQTERTGPLRYTLDHFVTLGCTDGPVCTNCRKPFGPVHFSTLHTKTGRTGPCELS